MVLQGYYSDTVSTGLEVSWFVLVGAGWYLLIDESPVKFIRGGLENFLQGKAAGWNMNACGAGGGARGVGGANLQENTSQRSHLDNVIRN